MTAEANFAEIEEDGERVILKMFRLENSEQSTVLQATEYYVTISISDTQSLTYIRRLALPS